MTGVNDWSECAVFSRTTDSCLCGHLDCLLFAVIAFLLFSLRCLAAPRCLVVSCCFALANLRGVSAVCCGMWSCGGVSQVGFWIFEIDLNLLVFVIFVWSLVCCLFVCISLQTIEQSLQELNCSH